MQVTLMGIFASLSLAALGASAPVGRVPPSSEIPTLEFAFEERVTIDPAIVLGDTALGHRQVIPITGGTVAGPKLEGQVMPGGSDFQLTFVASNCTQFSADYFLKSKDGTESSTKRWYVRARRRRSRPCACGFTR